MPGVAFVAHCMLNQNSKTIGGARCAGIYSPAGSDELAPGEGIFIEELRAEMAARGIKEPRAIGITNALPDHNRWTEKRRLEAFFGK